jgi:FlaG/FlaF family flagellin (archaellin)
MKRKSLSHDKRAVSAVIATVIIVAVTIAIAIAVAYWMGGLATIFTRFEKIEIKSAYVTKSGGDYIVTLNFINTGATATSIDSVMLNGVPSTVAWTGGSVDLSDTLTSGAVCETGVSKTGTITFPVGLKDPSGNELNPGVTLTITIHTTGGKDYHASVTLP